MQHHSAGGVIPFQRATGASDPPDPRVNRDDGGRPGTWGSRRAGPRKLTMERDIPAG
jgi:hypothetical protein